MIKHSILKQTSEGLVIDLYFSDRPRLIDFPAGIINVNGDTEYSIAVKKWVPDKTVKVDEGSKKQLLDYAVKLGHWDMKDFHAALQQGIEISPDVFEVKVVCHLLRDPAIPVELAFFKEKKEEKDLWPSDEELEKIIKVDGFSSNKRIYGAKQLRDYLKQKFEIKRKK